MMLPMTHVIYRDATNDARHLKLSCFVFSMRSSKHIRTVAIQITHVVYFCSWYFHDFHKNGSVQLRCKWHAYSHVFAVFWMKVTKTAQYHAATNDRICLHVSSYSPWNQPKRLGTAMLQLTRVIWFFFAIFPLSSPKRLGTMMLQIKDLIYLFHDIS